MDKIEKLKNEYQANRKDYEKQEDELLHQKDKAIAIIEDVETRSYHYVKDVVPNNDMLMQGYRQTEHMKDDVLELTKEKLKELARKIEQCDDAYYRELRKLNENKQ